MACYHLSAQIISRGKGDSVTAAAAYISGEKLRDSYDGRVYDRSYRKDVMFKEILLPPNAPTEFLDRQNLMDALNISEKRRDSQLARTIKLALPNELSFDRQLALAKEFIMEKFIKAGLCADVAIHRGELDKSRKPSGIEPVYERQDNPHAHIIVPFRAVENDGFNKNKTQNRYMNSVKYLKELRKEWADLQNREFERMGLDVRVSHESLAAQGIAREPTMHIGAATMALELQGIRTGRGDEYRGVIERNKKRNREHQCSREHTWERER